MYISYNADIDSRIYDRPKRKMIDWQIVAIIAAPIITLFIGAALNHFLQNRPKLVAHYGHVSGFHSQRGDEEPINIHTHSVVIRNVGRKSAKNIRVSHNYLPDYSVYPDITYEVNVLPGDGAEITIPTLVPKEEVIISYLYFPPITYGQILTTVKSDEGSAKIINVWLAPIVSK
ncbi:hypothetical protein LCGC14_3144670, partial [marine sediment metagenome]